MLEWLRLRGKWHQSKVTTHSKQNIQAFVSIKFSEVKQTESSHQSHTFLFSPVNLRGNIYLTLTENVTQSFIIICVIYTGEMSTPLSEMAASPCYVEAWLVKNMLKSACTKESSLTNTPSWLSFSTSYIPIVTLPKTTCADYLKDVVLIWALLSAPLSNTKQPLIIVIYQQVSMHPQNKSFNLKGLFRLD